MKLSYWASADDKSYFPRAEEKKLETLSPGVYEIRNSAIGTFFYKKKDPDTSELLRFDDTKVDEAVQEIRKFWTKKDLFVKHNFPFKRGILLHGPAGAGKSSAIKMIIEDVIKMNGIAVMFCEPSLFESGMEFFREIQRDTPVVVIIEDIDSWTDHGGEADITNILDGHSGLDNMVFLATTNYLDNLSDRIKNRPSRFDKKILIGPPNKQTRLHYLERLISLSDFKNVSIEKWADDSSGLTFAHLKELYLSVCFFEANYVETLDRLKDMIADDVVYKNKPSKLNLTSLAKLMSSKKEPSKYFELPDYEEEDDDDEDE